MRAMPGAVALVGLVCLAAPLLEAAYRDGPVPAVTGGFNEPTCQKCHFDNPLNDPEGSLQIEGVPEEYAAGRTYTLSVLLRRAGLKRGGFEMASRLADGSPVGRPGQQAGRFALGASETRLQIVTEPEKAVEYIQHTKNGSLAPQEGEQRWSVTWIAPAAAEGAVQFNVAANAANDDASPLGDFIYTKELRSKPKSADRAHQEREGSHAKARRTRTLPAACPAPPGLLTTGRSETKTDGPHLLVGFRFRLACHQ